MGSSVAFCTINTTQIESRSYQHAVMGICPHIYPSLFPVLPFFSLLFHAFLCRGLSPESSHSSTPGCECCKLQLPSIQGHSGPEKHLGNKLERQMIYFSWLASPWTVEKGFPTSMLENMLRGLYGADARGPRADNGIQTCSIHIQSNRRQKTATFSNNKL